MTKQMIVHFFNFDSKDLPLFLPKKVSEEPPNASIPDELLCCSKIRIIAPKAASAITTIVIIAIISRIKSAVSDANKLINIGFVLFVFLFSAKPKYHNS